MRGRKSKLHTCILSLAGWASSELQVEKKHCYGKDFALLGEIDFPQIPLLPVLRPTGCTAHLALHPGELRCGCYGRSGESELKNTQNSVVRYAIGDGCPHAALEHTRPGALHSFGAAAPYRQSRAGAGGGSRQHGPRKVGAAKLHFLCSDCRYIRACLADLWVRMDS